jgi:hypothetical protein
VDQAHRKANVLDADVVVASVASLSHTSKSRIGKYDPSEFKCIMVDEVLASVFTSGMRK